MKDLVHGKNEAGQTFEQEDAGRAAREAEDPPFKVVDKRGQAKDPVRVKGDPGWVQKIRRTGNPREFLAILPFNRKPEHYFVVSKIEDEGFELGLHPPKNPTKHERKAIEAARRRMRLLIEQARAFNKSDVQLQAPGPSQLAEPDKVQ